MLTPKEVEQRLRTLRAEVRKAGALNEERRAQMAFWTGRLTTLMQLQSLVDGECKRIAEKMESEVESWRRK